MYNFVIIYCLRKLNFANSLLQQLDYIAEAQLAKVKGNKAFIALMQSLLSCSALKQERLIINSITRSRRSLATLKDFKKVFAIKRCCCVVTTFSKKKSSSSFNTD